MKIKSQSIYSFLLYGILASYMLGPMLAFKVLGGFRIDNPLTILFILATLVIAFIESKSFPYKLSMGLFGINVMSGWSLIHLLITNVNPTQFMDLMFFASLPGLFYIAYLIFSRHEAPIEGIQKLLFWLVLFIAIPPMIELLTGFQFVNSDEELSLESGTIKGFFFNPNNLATTAVCMAPAILVFFNLFGRSKKEHLKGWLLFLLLGGVILASVSRTAIGCYFAILLLYLVYRGSALTTILVLSGTGLAFSLIPSEWIQNFLLSLNSNQFLERFSSRLYLFLYDLGEDNSVSYRQEIYKYFFEHPPALFYGYGPKNYREFFGGHVSDSLAFKNPHSFLVELYLAFGAVAMLAFVFYCLSYALTMLSNQGFSSKQRFFTLLSLAIFLVAGFIPSTIIRLPFIWLPCFLIFIYTVCNKSHIPENTNEIE